MNNNADEVYLLKPLDEVKETLKKQIDEGQEFITKPIHRMEYLKVRENEAAIWFSYTEKLLRTLFSGGIYANRFAMSDDKLVRVSSYSLSQQIEQFHRIMELRLTELKKFHREADLLKEAKPSIMSTAPIINTGMTGTKVFIVHGHDEAVKQKVARLLEHLEIKPIILHEIPNKSRTIIEKLEQESKDACYAIVLLTADDHGKSKNEEEIKHRARQNVVLELGYFIAKLGRERVCALYEEDVELPSDFDGVLYTSLDSADAWQTKLAKELKAAGFDIDLNKLP